ncbi:MAG: anhydro-N-acetylmuramic acid kinase [Gemmatimonadaceae bacterium]
MRDATFVGLMSGTSLDGISACVVRFTEPGSSGGSLGLELLAFDVKEYDSEQRKRLLAAMQGATAREYCRLAFDLGNWLADAALAAIVESGVPTDEIRAIGSHGQTVWHEAPHSTWQIGESAVIAERIGIDVVSDLRVRDVAAGGQGAPLVPIADALLFASNRWRALQNIGGIGNVTVVPPGGALSAVRAFDTGPGVGVLDAVVRALRPGQRYDKDGTLARAGSPIDGVIDELLAHPYFAAPPPKSTGRELFTPEYVARLIERCRTTTPTCSDEDIIATATALTARSIADAYRRFMPEPADEVLVSGGGAKNATLVRMISDAVAPKTVRQFDEVFFDGEAKEAVAFALLAKLFVQGVSGNVPSATGARGPRILGKLAPANRVLGRTTRN